jgi:hypothetical protein
MVRNEKVDWICFGEKPEGKAGRLTYARATTLLLLRGTGTDLSPRNAAVTEGKVS